MSWLLKGFLCLSVWLVLFPAGQVAAKSRQSRNEVLKVTVLSFDYVNVPERIQQAAQEQVVRIYRQAGVEMTWKDCRTKEEMASPSLLCSGLQEETRLYLRIVPRALNGLRNKTAGLAVRETQVVWIFWDRAQGQSRESGIPLSEMLAHLIAHEIGHLLLGPNAHAPFGIMAPC
jgi:hypothetical protein